MMTKLAPSLAAALLVPSALHAQALGVSGRVGTTGLGADVAVRVHPRVTVRGGVGFIPLEPEIGFSDIDFKISFPSPQLLGVVDLFPGRRSEFRLSGGVLVRDEGIDIDGVFTGTVDIGEGEYSGEEVGTLRGSITTRSSSPYLGLGWGRHTASGVGLVVDVGVAFQGDAGVELSADGPLAGDPTFEADLDREELDVEDDLGTFYTVYPVLSIGVRVGIGGPGG